ncbi:hypothetical protein N0V88_001788 [Collariella sp. IMI 366227]|nr:hypothetical protein N0V88_001788 [Collariella sp. IMI 366227]
MNDSLLPALSHALSGSLGTTLSTLLTYPLDLVTTRLKVQRQLQSDVWELISEQWFRASRLLSSDRKDLPPYLRVAEELAVGAAAGACAKLFTTPVSNVVTRRQTARLLESSSNDNKDDSSPQTMAQDRSFAEIVEEIRQERGVLGLWAGYSASLVLTLNPSITFFLQQMLKRAAVPREKWEEPGAGTTFLLAAVSKVVATAVTYPFSIAKARVQVSAPSGGEKEGEGKKTIFATVLGIARAEGPGALYDGIGGELLKGFFSHGTTMLSKDIIHGFIVRLYFAVLAALRRHPQFRLRLSDKMKKAREDARERYLRASSSGVSEVRKGARYVKNAVDSETQKAASLLSGGLGKTGK